MQKKRKDGGDSALDPRFAAARTDPRFQRFPKSQRKVDIDERFAGEDKDSSKTVLCLLRLPTCTKVLERCFNAQIIVPASFY